MWIGPLPPKPYHDTLKKGTRKIDVCWGCVGSRDAFGALTPWPYVLHVRRRSTSQYSVVHPAAGLHELLPGVLPGEPVKHFYVAFIPERTFIIQMLRHMFRKHSWLIFLALPLKMGVPGRGCALECKCFTGSPRRTPGSSPRSLAAAYAVLQSIILYWRKILLTLCGACSCSFLRFVNQRCGDAWIHCFDSLAASPPKIWIPGKGHFQPLAYKRANTH